MSFTINKLNESKFFLDKLEENKDKFPELNYYLNAFVSSARSVLWIMKSEYSSNDEWERWYKDKKTTRSEDDLLRGITDMRNRSLKKEPLKVQQFSIISLKGKSVDVEEEIKKYVQRHGKDKRYNISIESDTEDNNNDILRNDDVLMINGRMDVYHSVKEFKESNIIEKCIEYYSWLKSIVEECNMLFN